MIIIGLGTGRCGTLSLSKLLNLQTNCYITHEQKPVLNWYGKDKQIAIDRIASYTNKTHHIGDISSAYLNYVELIYSILQNSVRFICLEREKKQTIDSWNRKTKFNNWSLAGRQDPKWSKIFPKYNENNKNIALEMYWDEYHEKSNHLQKTIPVFRKFSTEDLNHYNSIIEILNFCQIKPTHIDIIHINQTKNSL